MCVVVKYLVPTILWVCVLLDGIDCAENDTETNQVVGRQLIEQGRTFVHHAVKRFMIILPAIFFKLGIAFTLLLLVAFVAINNGFIGFLILVVGLSSVLSRMQDGSRRPYPVPVYAPVHAHPFIDRSDTSTSGLTYATKSQTYGNRQNYYPQHVDRNDAFAYTSQISKLNDLVTQSQLYGNDFKNGEVVYGKYVAGK